MKPEQSRPLCLCTKNEPPLQELLDDPITRLLMERDGVQMEELTDFLAIVRKRLIAERWRRAA